jgi:HAD superfamily hydrolase (TIGR01450 family)
MANPVPRTSIAGLVSRYDALLFDAYGVLVHADGPLPGAPETIAALNGAGKPYCVVTNDASTLPENAAARYRRFGLALDADRIITSGSLLEDFFALHRLRGARCAVLGPQDSRRYVERAGGEVVAADEAFDVLVIGDETGFPFLETVDAALSSLFRRIDRGEPVRLVLPNPDLTFPAGAEGFGIAAGSVALMFEAALARRYPQRDDLRFARLGKPLPHLYEHAMRFLGTRNAVMIGDQLETDIAGAHAAGIASALIGTGVSNVDLAAVDPALRPAHWLPSLL